MSVESPPGFNQSGTYSAEQARRAWFGLLQRTGANTPGIVNGGLLSPSDCQLSAPVSGMSVNLSTGEMFIPGNEGAVQGAYYARVSSTTNLAISAASPSNPRIDLVCATVSDSAYTEPTGGSGNQWAPQVITGTPTSGATLSNLNGVGTLPGSSLLLGYVLVPTSATNIITADISNVAGLLTTGPPSLNSVTVTTTTTAKVGQVVNANTGGYTVTLPAAPTLNALVEVRAGTSVSGTSQVTVAAGASGVIYGVGVNGASSILLGAPGAFVLLQGDGTNWQIIGGQQDTGWVALSLGAGVSAGAGYTPAARLQGDTVRLSGSGTGSSITAWATIPSGLRPAQTVTGATYGGVASGQAYSITSAGAITSNASLGTFSFDGIAPIRLS